MYESIPDVMSVKEVADIVGVCSSTIYDAVKNGSLRSVRLGRKILVPKHCFIEYLHTADQSCQQQQT